MEQTIFLEALNKNNPWNKMQNLSGDDIATANSKDPSEWITSICKGSRQGCSFSLIICNCSESLIQQDPKR